MSVKTPLEMLYHWEKTTPDAVYLRQPIDGVFHDFTWAQVGEQVRRIANALIAQNFDQGSHIAILSKNCAEWFITDLAIMMAGHVSVPIYFTAGQETIRYVLTHSSWTTPSTSVPPSTATLPASPCLTAIFLRASNGRNCCNSHHWPAHRFPLPMTP